MTIYTLPSSKPTSSSAPQPEARSEVCSLSGRTLYFSTIAVYIFLNVLAIGSYYALKPDPSAIAFFLVFFVVSFLMLPLIVLFRLKQEDQTRLHVYRGSCPEFITPVPLKRSATIIQGQDAWGKIDFYMVA